MSVDTIQPVVKTFIQDDSADLLVLKGHWGVGKTYFWHNLAHEVSKAGTLGATHYAYVSLFGVNNLEDLRNAIIAARVATDDIDPAQGSGDWLTRLKKASTQLEGIPILREWTGGMGSALAFLAIRDTLVCFDDLERKGDNLRAKEVLGLAALLKEQRNCKVAIILNEDSLETDQKQEFHEHGEKIIDIELAFSSTSAHALSFVFSEGDSHRSLLSEFCTRLGITNIRIIQRIKRFAGRISPHLDGCEPPVVHAVLHSLVLFAWSRYDKHGQAPPSKYIKGHSQYASLLKDEDLSDDEKAWRDILQKYGYRYSDDVDTEVAKFVEQGYVDVNEFAAKLEAKNAQVKNQQGQDNYREAWKLYHNTFDNNEDQFIEQLSSSFENNMGFLSPMNLNGTVGMLRELGEDELADQLVDKYVAHHSSNLDILDLSRNPWRGDIKDPYLVDQFAEAASEVTVDRDLGEVLKKIASEGGWGGDDEDYLAACSVEEYYEFFKGEQSDRLQAYVQRALRFGQSANATEKQKAIAEKATAALKRIAAESRINRLRVISMHGIDIDIDEEAITSDN